MISVHKPEAKVQHTTHSWNTRSELDYSSYPRLFVILGVVVTRWTVTASERTEFDKWRLGGTIVGNYCEASSANNTSPPSPHMLVPMELNVIRTLSIFP